MHKPEVNYHIKMCLLTLNKNFDDTHKGLGDFMNKSLIWCSEMKSVLKNEIEKAKKSRMKKNPPVRSSRMLSNHHSVTRGTSAYVNNVINISEAHIHIANDSVSCRTRGALKSLQSSILAAGNMACNQTEETRRRSRSRTKAQNETIVIKRTAQEETLGIDSVIKKVKQEKLIMIETSKKNEEEVFKKPKPRGKKTKKAKESDLEKDLASEESITFNAVLHSSPKVNAEGNAFLASPMNISNITKSYQVVATNESPKKEEEHSIAASSTSNDFINDSKAETPKLGKRLVSGTVGGRDSDEGAETVKKISKKTKTNLDDTDKPISPKFDNEINNDETCGKVGVESTQAADSSNSSNKEDKIDQSNDVKETEKVTDGIDEKTYCENNEAVDSTESNLGASPEKGRGSRIRSGRIIRETRSVKAAAEAEPVQIKTELRDSTPSQDFNTTKVVPTATKRTKPVLKSRIFDSKGNILASVNSDKNQSKANLHEKPYALRSSSSTVENFIKKEVVTPDTSEAAKPIGKRQSCERRSNAENEPEVKRTKKTKRTKVKKTEEGEKDGDDLGRITRTKSKKAKQAMEEATVRKSGIIELARKSLNKAKLISLQKEHSRSSQALAARLAYQKRQISLSKACTGSRDDLLGSCNKLSVLMKNSVNLGSQVKPPKVQCLKSSESVMSTGKGKYLSLYTDSKDKFITPGKRCLSPDVGIKSTSKTAKEEEMEKELELKALRAQMKREMAIKMRQKELREKNEMKLQSAMKQRKKLEMEKYNSKIQLEKEKEEKHKLLLREREMTMKEKARLKKELMEQKLAEKEERRRMEEEARIAKLKEQEAEQQRIMLEKQKELERHEKRAQERLAEQKARENYEMKLKTEQMLREKQQQVAAAQSANKAAMLKGNQGKQWNYKPRNENDLGLDDEESDLDSENESATSKSNRPIPKWAQNVMNKDCRVKCYVKQEAMMEYMKCHQKTPDIHKMFKMTPNKRIKRTSSAIWNTPSS